MEREGEVGEVGRRRGGGGEMRKGIIVGGMVIGLLMGCNNGGEDPQKVFLKSVVGLGNEFLNVFTSFGEMIGGVLGFKVDTQKSEVGKYFKTLQGTVESTKEALKKIVADMEKENNPNAAAVKTKVDELIKNKLNNIIDGAKKASEAIGTDNNLIGNVAAVHASQNNGIHEDVDKLVEGIKNIVNIVLQGKGDADAGDVNGPVKDAGTSAGEARTDSNGTTDGNAGKLFAKDNAGTAADAAKAAKDAMKAVGAVTGADILQAIATGVGGKASALAKNTANVASITAVNGVKDATIAGSIALRAMAKGGKFANATSGDVGGFIAATVKRAAVSAVNKALDTLTIAIRKTIDDELKKVKDAMNLNANDSSVTSQTGANK